MTACLPQFDSPTLDLSDFVYSGGGPVATALVALSRLGVQTGYVGAIGEDEPGRSMVAAFDRESVDLRRCRVVADAQSPVCLILVQKGTGKRAILCYRGSVPELQLQDEDRSYLVAAEVLHLDGHHMQAAITVAKWMKDSGGTVVLDANKPRPRLGELLRWTDVLIANSSFPQSYTGEPQLDKAAGRLLQAGPRLVVSTLGPRGCACFSSDSHLRVDGFSVPVVDTTGAGDAFHGGFIYGMLQDWPLKRTAKFANAVAVLNCRSLGGRMGLPSLHEVHRLLGDPDLHLDAGSA
jgi:sugar/nucleoside kinase (ribokinase family)